MSPLTIIKLLSIYETKRNDKPITPIRHQRKSAEMKFTLCGKYMAASYLEADDAELTTKQMQAAQECNRCGTLAEEFNAAQRAEIKKLRTWNRGEKEAEPD